MPRIRYELQRKETVYMPNILGNHSMSVPTFRWKGIALSNDRSVFEEAIKGQEKLYRIEDRGEDNG
jgi:predicted transcriptional regulator